MRGRSGRSGAEWVTFAISCVVLAALAGLILMQLLEPRTAASPVVTATASPIAVDGQHQVAATVTNLGDETAAEVQVSAELTVEGTTTTADQTIDFLAGDEEHDLVFVFADDPSAGDLTISVSSFSLP